MTQLEIRCKLIEKLFQELQSVTSRNEKRNHSK